MRTRNELTWWIVIVCSFCFAFAAAAADGGASIQTLEQYTRIQLPVTGGTSFRLNSRQGVEAKLTIDRIRVNELERAKLWSDARVESVSVQPLGIDSAEVTIRFREGSTESFAYLQGHTLVIDLWKQASTMTKAEEEKPVLVAASPIMKKKAGRAIASISAPAHELASAHSNSAKHQEAESTVSKRARSLVVEPLKKERDLFQKFSLAMPELKISSKESKFEIPSKLGIEDRWKFANGDKAKEDGKAFEFAKKLFKEKKFGLTIKTIEIVQRDHPESIYSGELSLLKALAYKKLGEVENSPSLQNQAKLMLEELAARRSESGEALPFHHVIRLYFGEQEYRNKNWLNAIGHLEFVQQSSNPEDPQTPYTQIILAEAYVKTNQPRRAERIYRYITEKYPKHILAKESAYRIADLLAVERNYNRVSNEGERALQLYPEYEKARAEVLFNIGEANFWLNRYEKAEKYLRRYIDVSSGHTNSGLAWVRLGEILEISKNDLKSARAAYMHAKNGFPFSQGDLVATVRLARIDLPNEKEPHFVVKTLSEMLKDSTIDWDLRRMAELTYADYLLLSNEVDQAIELNRSGMAQTDGTVYELYKKGYIKSLFSKLEVLNREKKFADALSLYDREKKWIDQYGPESFKAAADTYNGLGLFATSNQFMERYAKEASGSRGLASVVRKQLDITKARNSFAKGTYAETLENLPESNEFETLYMRAISLFRLGQEKQAFPVAAKALSAVSSKTAKDEQLADLAEILIERDTRDRDFARMETELLAIAKRLEKENDRITFAIADSLWFQKKHAAAVPAYRAALEKFPKSPRADRAKYNLGLSFVSLGKRDDAVKQLTELRDSSQSVWADSAKQELQLLEWEKKYSSVLRTLPPSGLGISN